MVTKIISVIGIEQPQKEVKKIMPSPTTVSAMVAELLERGMRREDLADLLGVKPQTVSMLKNSQTSIDDGKLRKLARVHGRYTEKEALVLKYLDWLASEKDISVRDIQNVLQKTAPSLEAAKVA